MDFYAEVAKNLESYYVMDQREYFRPFRMEAWRTAGTIPALERSDAVREYVESLKAYNEDLAGMEEFERWYSSDVNNRTRENARILHDKKTAIAQRFPSFEGIIKKAKKAVEDIFIGAQKR